MHRLVASLAAVLVVASSGAAIATAQDASPPASPAADLAGVTPRSLTAERLAEFEAYVAAMLAKTGVPGAAVAVVQNGEVVYRQGFGVRALGDDAPVTPDTLMMIGSVTKPMTATMAATLVDDGTLTWDTPVVDLLPGFAVADPELTRRLTVRNAFCACTGLPERDPELIFNADSLTPERLVAQAARLPLIAPLGERFQYSNQMFGIGGYAAAVAAAGGSPDDLYDAYVTAMRERVLDPLGMTRSAFALDDVVASGDHAQPHGQDLAGAYRPASLEEDERYVNSVAPAGALWSSAAEMARYVRMELAGGVAPDGTRVVSAENLGATWQPQVAIPAPPAEAGVPTEFASMLRGYGLGWVDGDYRGQRMLWHSGGTYGFSTQAALLPDAGLGLVVLTNGINADLVKLAVQFRLFELAFGRPAAFDPVVQAGIAAGIQQSAELQRQLAPVDPVAVAPYLGRYANPMLGEVELALRDGRLVFDAGEMRSELRALADEAGQVVAYLFTDPPLAGRPAPVTLQQGADGRPEVAVTVEGDTPEATQTYVLTLLASAAAATPAP